MIVEEFKKRLDNIEDINLRNIVSNVISNPNWVNDVDLDTYVYIMELLGYSKNESLDSYRKVLKKSYDE
ncbi:MAG TPA: hypothetical protein DHU33_00465 [Firmicutes bacterium]|nr:hypothetical protein [Bacillota bacterium]